MVEQPPFADLPAVGDPSEPTRAVGVGKGDAKLQHHVGDEDEVDNAVAEEEAIRPAVLWRGGREEGDFHWRNKSCKDEGNGRDEVPVRDEAVGAWVDNRRVVESVKVLLPPRHWLRRRRCWE